MSAKVAVFALAIKISGLEQQFPVDLVAHRRGKLLEPKAPLPRHCALCAQCSNLEWMILRKKIHLDDGSFEMVSCEL